MESPYKCGHTSDYYPPHNGHWPGLPCPPKHHQSHHLYNRQVKDRHHDSMCKPMQSAGMVPYSTPKHDDSHIHHASPIHGLPPENQLIQCVQEPLWQEDNLLPQYIELERLSRLTGKGPPVCLTLHPIQSLELPVPPTLPNTCDGPKAVMPAIDKWFKYQDQIQLLWMARQGQPKTNIHILPPCPLMSNASPMLTCGPNNAGLENLGCSENLAQSMKQQQLSMMLPQSQCTLHSDSLAYPKSKVSSMPT